jgi:hypothetical protein
MKSIFTQAIITGIRSKVDRSLGISLSTPELSTQEKALFMELQGINTEITIKPLDEKPEGIEKIDKEVGSKTQSQRLRAVIYILWEQEGKQGMFDDFYRSYTEKIIDWIKSKLD